MRAIKHMKRLQRINELITEGNTGTPDEFAKKLNISSRQFYRYLAEFKSYGVNITYSRAKRRFEYDKNTKVEVEFSILFVFKDKTIDITEKY